MKMVFTRRFCSAHRLMSDKSPKCQNPHGHNWEVKVTVEVPRSEKKPLDLDINMVEEFGAAKKRWHTWIDDYVDHSIMLNQSDHVLIRTIRELVPHTKMMLVPGDPTTEITCALFMAKLNAFLKDEHGGRLICTRIELVETPTNTVVFDEHENDHVPPGHYGDRYEDFWWHRSDMTTLDEHQLAFMEVGA